MLRFQPSAPRGWAPGSVILALTLAMTLGLVLEKPGYAGDDRRGGLLTRIFRGNQTKKSGHQHGPAPAAAAATAPAPASPSGSDSDSDSDNAGGSAAPSPSAVPSGAGGSDPAGRPGNPIRLNSPTNANPNARPSTSGIDRAPDAPYRPLPLSFGGRGASASSMPPALSTMPTLTPTPSPTMTPSPAPGPALSPAMTSLPTPMSAPTTSRADVTGAASPPALSEMPLSAAGSPNAAAPKRESRPVTSADPLLTRVSLIRSDQGKQFGVFMQIFADGTVIDSQGVHSIPQGELLPIAQLARDLTAKSLSGHLGNASTGYLDQVIYTVYQRTGSFLQATTFSHAGELQGQDAAVVRLQGLVEELQMKLDGSAYLTGSAPAGNGASLPIPDPNPVLTSGGGVSADAPANSPRSITVPSSGSGSAAAPPAALPSVAAPANVKPYPALRPVSPRGPANVAAGEIALPLTPPNAGAGLAPPSPGFPEMNPPVGAGSPKK